IDSDYARNVPIVALTANALAGNENMFIGAGFQAFISKPIDIMKLDRILSDWVGHIASKGQQEAAINKRGDEECALESKILGAQIEGLEAATGIASFGGAGIYLSVLESYAKNTAGLLDKIRAVDEDKLDDYVMTMHGIKGSSRGICAVKIGNMAEAMESAGKDRNLAGIRAKNGAFIGAAEKLISELSSLLGETVSAKPHNIGRRFAPDPALLKLMLENCRSYDMTAMEQVMSEVEKFDYDSGGELVKWLREKLDNLDYEEIAERLSNVLNAA
ncbi:MAG: hypothetical protein LBU26_04395, partial [Synergistaceae bacterium]|nr:hypothetical protein [Synergistaceae bacterium]